MSRIQKNRLISRRLFVLGVLYCTTIGTLAGRLYYLQILCNNKYKTLSDSNRIKVLFVDPVRGQILDLNRKPIATNQQYYNISCDPEHLPNNKGIAQKLSTILPLTKENKEALARKIKQGKPFTLMHNINWDTLASIEFNKTELGGIYISKYYQRFYPYHNSCSHLAGYIGPAQVKSPANYQHGKAGLEAAYDEELSGSPGMLQREVNSKGVVVRELTRTKSVNGGDIQISIDADLQHYIHHLFEDRQGAAVVINTNNGNLMALCSLPAHDNNQFITGFSKEEWEALIRDPHKPLMNRALTLQIPPGSTFKLVSSLAALESRVINERSVFRCEGYVMAGQRKFHCWKRSGHGDLDLRQAIARSCNSYFYQIGQRINIDDLVETAGNFGLGKNFNTKLPEEVSGIIPTKKWRQHNLGNNWMIGNTLNTVIGHGYILVTPLQLAVLTGRIASGRMIMPTIKHSPQKLFPEININHQYLHTVRGGMFDVINSASGTAHRIYPEPSDLAGKTGTVQVIGSHNKGFQGSTKNLDHALFIGYAPYDNPKYAVSIIIEHGGAGGNAALLAKKIFRYLAGIN